MNPDDPLLKILACPLDKGPLHLLGKETGSTRGPESTEAAESTEGTEAALYNPRLRRRYPIVDGIPQLLPSSGEQVTDDEHEDLLLRITGGDDLDGSRGDLSSSSGDLSGSRGGPRKPGSMTP
ncbi:MULTISPECIES: Trm112 family protein [Streptomyces]|uniref:Trm112 family protein n=1 Tax=Streptomyces TaxID=1883 RepID=UPI00200C6EF1|nr:Trm112 family protein [Streptomyces sp. LRE541]UPZ31403.1 Trm112 family protein [Streptomyces sp. LRE541]